MISKILEDNKDRILPNYRLGEILKRIPDIRKWCADIESKAHAELINGNPVEGFKLVAGRSTRAWKNSEKAEKALRTCRKLKVKDILPAKLVSPTQAESC